MQKIDKIYKALQKHLDKQPVGYPATTNGVELRLLKQMFTPEEANLALHMSYQLKTAKQIYAGMIDNEMSLEHLESLLDQMTNKMVIFHIAKNDNTYYCLMPLIVGMYEGQINNLTPQYIKDFDEYTSKMSFGLSFLATKLPQMRTIPIEKSITPAHRVMTYDHLESILKDTPGPFAVNECICRKSMEIKNEPCRKTKRNETCLAVGEMAEACFKANWGRRIKREEAFSIMRQNQADGLILQPNNSQQVEFICACCGCCCGMLRVHKFLPKPNDFWASNFYATIDSEACTGCTTCVSRCEVNALSANDDQNIRINLDRCLGCGNCVPTCPAEAIQLIRKNDEVIPPATRVDLYDTIMQNKKGAWAKAKLAFRLMRKK